MPFLDKTRTPEAMERFLAEERVVDRRYPPPISYLALLKHKRGDKRGACAIRDELQAKALDQWRSRVAEIAESLECRTIGAQAASRGSP